eukprot:scaffold1351_cov176-Amphora_coffeaeformis.AAC.27
MSDSNESSDFESLPSPRKTVRFKDEYEEKKSRPGSRYDGVYFVNGTWEARIKVDHRWYSLGSFYNEDEAGLAFANFTRIYKPKKGTKDVYGAVDLSRAPPKLPLLKNRNYESGYSGVTRSTKGWRATICVQGTKKVLGTYETPEEAAQVYARVIYRLGQLKYKRDKNDRVPLQVVWTNKNQMHNLGYSHKHQHQYIKKKKKKHVDTKRASIHQGGEVVPFTEANSCAEDSVENLLCFEAVSYPQSPTNDGSQSHQALNDGAIVVHKKSVAKYLEDHNSREIAALIASNGPRFGELAKKLKEYNIKGASIAAFLLESKTALDDFLLEVVGVDDPLLRFSVIESLEDIPRKLGGEC